MATIASPGVRHEMARGMFEAAQRDAQDALARLDPYLMSGDDVPPALESELRRAQAKLSEAKAVLDAAARAKDACEAMASETAALALVAEAPANALRVVAERENIAREHTRVSQREDDLALERTQLLRDRAGLEDAVSKERAGAAALRRELLETQAYKRRLEQDLARATEAVLTAERRAAAAEFSMRAEQDLRIRYQRVDDADRVRDLQNAYNHARQAMREHQAATEEEVSSLKQQVKKTRDDEQEAVLLMETERVARMELEATMKKFSEDAFERQRRTDEEISNLTAALREATKAQRAAEGKAMDERDAHNRAQDAGTMERGRAAEAHAAAEAARREAEVARSQEAAANRRATQLETTLTELKDELAKERGARAEAEATAAASFEKQGELDVAMKEATAAQSAAEAAKDSIDSQRLALEDALAASKQDAAQVRQDNGQIRNALDAAKAALAAQKGAADAARERADWAEGEVGRLTRVLASERDEMSDMKRQVSEMKRASDALAAEAAAQKSKLLGETAQLEADCRALRAKAEHLVASETSARARADDYAEEVQRLRSRMAGSMRAAQEVGQELAAKAEEEASDVKIQLDEARREVRALTEEVTTLREKHADAVMKINGEKAAAVAAAEGAGADLRHELGTARAQLATARAATAEANEEINHLRAALAKAEDATAQHLAAADVKALERQREAVAAAVSNAEKLASREKQVMTQGFDGTIEALSKQLHAAKEEAAKQEAEAARQKERADTATMMRDRAQQNANYADDNAERANQIVLKLQETNAALANEKDLVTAASEGDAVSARAAADKMGAQMAEARRVAAVDRARALAAERALAQQTQLAEIAAGDAARAAARAAAAEDRALAAEARAKAVATEAAKGDRDAMAALDARLKAEQDASEAKRLAREALATVDTAKAAQEAAQAEMMAMRKMREMSWPGHGRGVGPASGGVNPVSQYAVPDVAAARARDAAIAKARGLAEAQEEAMVNLRLGEYAGIEQPPADARAPIVAASAGAEGMSVRAPLQGQNGNIGPGGFAFSSSYTM